VTLLNATDAVPSVLVLIYRFLLHESAPVATERLNALLSPRPLQGGDTSIFRGTLKTCEEIGLISIADNQVRLHPDLPFGARDPATGECLLRTVVRDLVLAPECNTGDLWDGNTGMRDFTRAIAWMLTKDPYDSPGTYERANRAQNADFGKAAFFNTNLRWITFQRWATFLQFGWIDSVGAEEFFQIDPTPTVRAVAAGLFADRRTWRLPEFVLELGRQVPVLDGGVYRLQIEAGVKSDHESSLISQTLGLALRRLEAERSLRLEKQSDIESLGIVDSAGGTLTYSHVHAV
jgi:hypothetical protein